MKIEASQKDSAFHNRCTAALICASVLAWPIALLARNPPDTARPQTMRDVLAASSTSDWRRPNPDDTLYLELASGRVVIELNSEFAPLHVANIKTLVRAHYFDGLSINRVQDNFVTQWGDPRAGEKGRQRSLGNAKAKLASEFTRTMKGLPFTRLPDGDVYAPEVGFSRGMPVARDAAHDQAWLVHCYGMVGVGRDNDIDSGNGAELYVVIGQAPRQLDRNIALVGRVLDGIERLSALPRGDAPLGLYKTPAQRIAIHSMRIAADVPKDQRSNLRVLRTDTSTFAALVESRRNRRDMWYHVPAGKIDLCNVPLPVRKR
ncbi:MAG: peptidylprolyl isomerase [Rhodanobacteraceae bacterium]